MNNHFKAPKKGTYILYGADISLYSAKLRCYLKKKGIPYQERAATYSCYKNFIVPRTGVRFIPVLHTANDEVWQDTTEIIDRLEQKYNQNPAVPESPKQQVAAHLIEMYADQWLLKTALYSRWYASKASLKEIWTGFGQLLFPKFPQFLQRIIGKKISAKFRGFMPGLGINPETYEAIEKHTEQLTNVLDVHFSNHDFILGGMPSVADYALMGVYYAHLYRDLDSGQKLKSSASNVVMWIKRMISDEIPSGEYLADDEVPDSLDWIFKVIAEQQAPVMIDTAEALVGWQGEHNAEEVPRILNEHEFEIEGVQSTRKIIAHAQYMMQRPLRAYQEHDQDISLTEWVASRKLLPLLSYVVQCPIERQNNRFIFC